VENKYQLASGRDKVHLRWWWWWWVLGEIGGIRPGPGTDIFVLILQLCTQTSQEETTAMGHVRHLTFRHVDSLFRFSIKFVDSEFGCPEPGSYT